jgi:hypothetical protein
MNPPLSFHEGKKDSKKKGKNPQSALFIGKKSKIEKPITTARNNIEGGIIQLLRKNNGYK